MMRSKIRSFAGILVGALLLSSCSGGGGGSALPSPRSPISLPTSIPSIAPTSSPTSNPVSPQATTTNLIISIGDSADLTQKSLARKSSSNQRSAKYISASAMGVKVSAPGLTTQAFDVSAGSPLCTGSGAGRVCTLGINATPASYVFTLGIYDAKPVAGVIPGPANLLGLSTVSQTINPNVPNTLNFAVAGQITSLANALTYISLPASGSLQSTGIVFLASDHGANPINSGAFANPITATLSETGGSGHAYLKVNGVNVGATGTINQTTDTLTINYDGAGSPGYTDTVGFSAAGSTTSTVRMSPLFVSGSASPTGAGNTANLTITEASAPVSVAYMQTLTGCSGVATVPGAGAGSGASGSASVTDTLQPAGGKTCTLTISDNLGSSIPLTVTIPAGTPTCASSAAATQLTPAQVASGTPCVPSPSYGVTATYATSSGSLTVTEANDQSTLTETDTCAGLATVSPASRPGAASATGTASGTFTVTATANSNASCTVSVHDGNGQISTFPITIAPQAPPIPKCGEKPNGQVLGTDSSGNVYVSNGTYCGMGNSGGSPTTISVSGAGRPTSATALVSENNYTQSFTTVLSGNCSGFSAFGEGNNSNSYYFSRLIVLGGNAMAPNIGTSCTFTVTDSIGQSISFTFNTVP